MNITKNPGNSIDLEGKNLMSSCYNKSLEKVNLKYTYTQKFSIFNYVKSNIYFSSPSIYDYTDSDILISTTYRAYLNSIDKNWEDCARKYEEEISKHCHNRFVKYTMKQNVQKLNKIYIFSIKSFEQHCILLN